MLAALPLQTEHSGLSRWVWLKKANPSGTIKPPVYSYQLFWLDTFCIPQDTQHADLKRKAIDSMNLIYAAAWQTIVFDASLQKFDAGKRPNSLIRGIRGEDASFYSPACHNLPDVLAQICASNWMGRAW
jgi:hypothetical protein